MTYLKQLQRIAQLDLRIDTEVAEELAAVRMLSNAIAQAQGKSNALKRLRAFRTAVKKVERLAKADSDLLDGSLPRVKPDEEFWLEVPLGTQETATMKISGYLWKQPRQFEIVQAYCLLIGAGYGGETLHDVAASVLEAPDRDNLKREFARLRKEFNTAKDFPEMGQLRPPQFRLSRHFKEDKGS